MGQSYHYNGISLYWQDDIFTFNTLKSSDAFAISTTNAVTFI